MGGVNFNMENDDEILQITTPKERLKGPYIVVYKNVTERWAIVAMDWDDDHPSLGMRWFKGPKGNPISTGHPTWLILPAGLYKSILDGLPINYKKRVNLEKFLTGEISGQTLKENVTHRPSNEE